MIKSHVKWSAGHRVFILDRSSTMFHRFGTILQVCRMNSEKFAFVKCDGLPVERWFNVKYLATMKDVEDAQRND